MEEETKFLLKRAKEEATQAIRSADERVANAHQKMAVRYSARALIELASQDPDVAPMPKVIEEPESFPR